MNRERPKALSPQEMELSLAKVPLWSLREGKLYRRFEFGDFLAAMNFMSGVAPQIEALAHHPEWLNAYNRLEVWIVTHEAAGASTPALTEWDFRLAKLLDRSFIASIASSQQG